MVDRWKDSRPSSDEKKVPSAPVKEPMPAVSPEFMAWLKKVLVQDITGTTFQTMQPNDALKQISFCNGVLWLKALIYAGNDANQARKVEGMIVAPDSTPKE